MHVQLSCLITPAAAMARNRLMVNVGQKKLLHLQTKTWEGYLIASQGSSNLGTSTAAQDLLRKRYVGISGSNKLIGALEIQQVGFLTVSAQKSCTA